MVMWDSWILWVESEGLRKGATFYFTIPAAENPR